MTLPQPMHGLGAATSPTSPSINGWKQLSQHTGASPPPAALHMLRNPGGTAPKVRSFAEPSFTTSHAIAASASPSSTLVAAVYAC